LRRDRHVVLASLLLMAALAWIYVAWLAAHMQVPAAAPMPGMDMGGGMAPAIRSWRGSEFAIAFVMWTVMMVGMMVPSAAPMILLYARVGRQAAAQQKPFAGAGWFTGGYILAWAGFSLVATAGQFELTRFALLSPMLQSTNSILGGSVLVVAGLYQWSPFKEACLVQCQSPLAFIQRNGGFKAHASGALALGIRHGLYCVGCCWALMLLLFVGGIMNIAWIAGLAVLVFLEKLLKNGRLFHRAAGILLVCAGVGLIGPHL
jgi:predicted metal-binding membrane protein